MGSDVQNALLRTVTRVASALRPAEVPFALTGGCAVFARGGPETEHDVDILLRRQDVQAAVTALVAAGMRAADPPEEWLTKVYDGDRLVDLRSSAATSSPRPSTRPMWTWPCTATPTSAPSRG